MNVELEIYSGRPNPSWNMTQEEADTLDVRLLNLAAYTGEDPLEPLGYRGLRISAIDSDDGGRDGRSIWVGAGLVVVVDARGETRRFADDSRSLECWLLQTAYERVDEALRRVALADIGPGCA